MQTIIKTLTQDLADHQQVENELAKRSHFCQKVIKKYREQIKQLKEDIEKQNQSANGGNTREQQRRNDETDLMNYLNGRIA